MDELKERLTKELQQNFNVKIMKSKSWSLPVHLIEVEYNTVERTKMDILMKMMLTAFQKTEIETAEELSDILLVETLFINDLIDKMLRTDVIVKENGCFTLTAIGLKQIETGIFVHASVEGTKQIVYSPHHQSFLIEGFKDTMYQETDDYRYQNEFVNWTVASLEDSEVVDALKRIGVEKNEGDVQTVVSEVITTSAIQIDQLPCLEFHLYNAEEDVLYARVWNTRLGQWDKVLESALNDKERKEWREVYL